MNVIATAIPDVKIIKPKVFFDERGFFMGSWNAGTFKEAGIEREFVQDNHSRSVKYTLRGLHYQIRQPQGKLVGVVTGEVFDVAVDLRQGSPISSQWIGEILSSENKRQLYVPEGFGHGFLVLSETADFLYKTTSYYAPEHERCIIWNDAELGIDWPMVGEPLLSGKDQAGQPFSAAEVYSK